MKIIIAGGGMVGFTLAENLVSDDHDIYLIDTDEAVLKHADDTLDVMCVKGNGASIETLRAAGVETADVLIAVTDRDELNMLCCLMAKKLGAKYTIARVRDIEYSADANRIKRELDIDMLVNPENATAMRISRILRFPEAIDIDVFYRGRIELVGFRIEQGDIIAGRPLYEVRKRLGNLPVLFCAHEHGGKTVIPNGASVFQPGDKVYVIGNIVNVSTFFRTLGRIEQKPKSIFITGGGRICLYLAKTLCDIGMNVKIFESDLSRCHELCELLPKALLISGDGTDQELLSSENIAGADAFVSLTDLDEANLITALYAKHAGVPKAIATVTKHSYSELTVGLDIDSVVSPKMLTAYYILRKVRGMQNTHSSHMEALFPIAGGAAEAIEFTVGAGTHHLGVPLRSLNIKKGVLISVIVRKDKFIVPEGDDHLEEGDNIIIVTTSSQPILEVNDMYDE